MMLSTYPLNTALALDSFIQLEEKPLALLFIIPILLLGFFFIFLSRFKQQPEKKNQLGFWSITPHKQNKFYPIDGDIQNMEPVVKMLADQSTNVYSNLSKITLTIKGNSVFLEEKNYKISILVNRRRSRRCFLYHGDILDMGELTLMFSSPEEKELRHDNKIQSSHLIPRLKKANTKLIRNCPTLIPLDNRKKTFYITKNLTLVGRSETNDLTPKSKAVSLYHSKIEKIAGRYKINDLNTLSGTFVNGRRIETKFLRDGDSISFESIKYTFSSTGRAKL